MTWRLLTVLRRTAIAAIALASSTACARNLEANTTLDGGRRLRDVVHPTGLTVVLFYRPEDCFGCLSTLDEWRRLERKGVVRIAVVLDRDPTPTESDHLRAERLVVAGIYRPGWTERRLEGPLEFLADSSGRRLTTADSPSGQHRTSALILALAIGAPESSRDSNSTAPKRQEKRD